MKKRKQKQIPDFKSYEEEAAFWDTHDFTEYTDGFKPVKIHFAKNLSETLNIRLDPETLVALKTEAYKKGIGPTTLVRMLVKEHISKAAAG